MNEELRHRTREVHQVNSFLETVLGTMGIGVAVVDDDHRVQIWNGDARELRGLSRTTERGVTRGFSLPKRVNARPPPRQPRGF